MSICVFIKVSRDCELANKTFPSVSVRDLSLKPYKLHSEVLNIFLTDWRVYGREEMLSTFLHI